MSTDNTRKIKNYIVLQLQIIIHTNTFIFNYTDNEKRNIVLFVFLIKRVKEYVKINNGIQQSNNKKKYFIKTNIIYWFALNWIYLSNGS